MKARKIVGLLGTMLAVGALALSPTVTRAQVVDSPVGFDVVAFSACATGVNVPLSGGTGTYGFNSNAGCVFQSTPVQLPGVCVGLSDPSVNDPADPILNEVGASLNGAAVVGSGCNITVNSGSYSNIVCGTGTTGGGVLVGSDTATITGEGEINTISYGIDFVAGVGVIVGKGTSAGELGTVVGVVVITATQGNCVSPVLAFQATGVAVLVDNPGQG